jgi:ribosomal protein L21E
MTALIAVRESQRSRHIEIFMKPFENGSKVKLTDRYAKTLEKARGNPNWVGRLGTVICCNRFSVSILWEGRMSVDHVPHKAVELALHRGSESRTTA